MALRFALGVATLVLTLCSRDVLSETGEVRELRPEALVQIREAIQEKESRTPAQRKIDSGLLRAVKTSRGEVIGPHLTALRASVETDELCQAVVDITAEVSDEMLERIAGLGGTVLSSHAGLRSVRVRMPLESIEKVAALPDVQFVQPKQEAVTNGSSGRRPFVINVSQGDVTHRANVARSVFGATGAGVKVGVLSDGVDSLTSLQSTGDLPLNVSVLPGQAGSGNEGAAMLEIVHDLAPDATLYFATGGPTVAQFHQNILDLRAAGCDVIVDDVGFFVESPFQAGQTSPSPTNGGLVTEAVRQVTLSGALYFSSAANSGNKDSSWSGTWEGDFVDGGAAPAPMAGGCTTSVGLLETLSLGLDRAPRICPGRTR